MQTGYQSNRQMKRRAQTIIYTIPVHTTNTEALTLQHMLTITTRRLPLLGLSEQDSVQLVWEGSLAQTCPDHTNLSN